MKNRIFNNELNKSHLEKDISIFGWIHNKRDHGKIIFIDIRDRTGIIQCCCTLKNISKYKFNLIKNIKIESVIEVLGILKKKPKDNNLLEIMVKDINIINKSIDTPFLINDDKSVHEDLRLKYRFLDLRKQKMQNNIIFRHNVVKFLRRFLDKNKFIEIDTPILSKSTPEGARDYVVPSRNYKNKFFALPQSPQIFKQILMISGFDRYYQVAKCFRDEDLRSNRQPEFTQIDIEMSFVKEQDIMNMCESLIKLLFKKLINIELPNFKILSYKNAIENYGTDKPDLRIPFKINNILKKNIKYRFIHVKNLECKKKSLFNNIFKKIIKISENNCEFLINIKNHIEKSNKFKITKEILSEIKEKVSFNKNNDFIFIAYTYVDKYNINSFINKISKYICKIFELYRNGFYPVWVNDFPLFKNDNNNISSFHHPFVMPKSINNNNIDFNNVNSMISHSYDLVINGEEIGGGSIRINNRIMQERILEIIKSNKSKFKFFLNALEYGTPIHGGIAFGLERLLMTLLKTNNIRDVIVFPKTQSANCLMTDSPDILSDIQIKDLNL